MSDFHELLIAVHGEIWEGGTTPRSDLSELLSELVDAPMPAGVVRLPTAAMAPGPHLAAQDECGEVGTGVLWLEAGRLARSRAKRFASL
ncbi:MAG: hypothetical protein AAGG09_21465 [Pseudomonadota bacterium]